MSFGWLLVCLPIAAAVVATAPAVRPRPKFHPVPRAVRPVGIVPHVPDAIRRPRPRVVRPRPQPVPVAAPACEWWRVPVWLADDGGIGYAPGWWPGYAPAYGSGFGGGYGPVHTVSHGGVWGGGSWGGGWSGRGWIGGPSYYASMPYPVPAPALAYAFASAEANALAVAVVTAVVAPGGPDTTPGSVPPRVEITVPPGVPPGMGTVTPQQDVPEPAAAGVLIAGLLGLWGVRRRRG